MNLLKFLEPKPDTSVTRQIWSKENDTVTAVEERPTSEIIQEIHDTFSTEVDRLLIEAGIKKESDHLDTGLIDRARRMRNLGFGNTSTVKEAQKTEQELMDIEKVNREKGELREAIEYFTFKYPSYKFITEQSVKTICQKYGLIYGTVDRYIGDVPEKNLKEIEAFSISEEDEAWEIEFRSSISGRHAIERGTLEEIDRKHNYIMKDSFYSRVRMQRSPLEIAAPVKDFNLDGMHVEDFQLKHNKIDIPDPIVLKPVIYKGKDYRLIVTMWGDEANDPLVQNPKNN